MGEITMIRLLAYGIGCVIVMARFAAAQGGDPLTFHFGGKYGQVEAGGPYAGAEFHLSRPLPSRISFYYPVANSIDLSTDYWKRHESMPMAFGVKIGNGSKHWIGKEGWEYQLSPHNVTFTNSDSILSYDVEYEFCLNEPAMVVTWTLKNRSTQPQPVTAYAHLLLALRTCQTYTRKDSALMTRSRDGRVIAAAFTDRDTKEAACFVANGGTSPSQSWLDANDLSITDGGTSAWTDQSFSRIPAGKRDSVRTRGVAAFEYAQVLQPDDEMRIVLIIGSVRSDEVAQKVDLLTKRSREETNAYDRFVRRYAMGATRFATGETHFDRSIHWAKGILAANAHYLNGAVVPMPCPAEYNFFFTHDVLMTDLGAVNFDVPRVKRDLLYVASLAQDSVIPHAYYWRDDGFKTELCTPSNWNHLWFIEVASRYLRHSLDTSTIRLLYPLLTKSMNDMLTLLREDHLMYAFRPDWWDIGWHEGPRTYITSLGIRQIENYLYIASMIDRHNARLQKLEAKARLMRMALADKLWDDSLHYLINYNGSDKDRHKYMGSLLAPALKLLDIKRSEQLIESARRDLLAPRVGIRAAMPADFHTDSSIAYFKFAGKEAGDPYAYINGGVWPHNNAWYALALHAVGKSNEAKEFVRQTMTIDGIADSPNGIPAMYEYRFSDESSPRYGEIDKPSFLWAGGFYLSTMYTLSGMNDNVWNLSFAEQQSPFDSSILASYSIGELAEVKISGTGNRIRNISYDDIALPSLVVPLEKSGTRTVSIVRGTIASPYLKSATGIVRSVRRENNRLTCSLSSFAGHSTTVEIVSPKKPRTAAVNGKKFKNAEYRTDSDGAWISTFTFSASAADDTLTITW